MFYDRYLSMSREQKSSAIAELFLVNEIKKIYSNPKNLSSHLLS